MLEKFNMDQPAKRAVWILFLANLLNYMDRFTVAGILTHITKEFHLTSAQTGLLQVSKHSIEKLLHKFVFTDSFYYCVYDCGTQSWLFR